jgi:hypothetical protein
VAGEQDSFYTAVTDPTTVWQSVTDIVRCRDGHDIHSVSGDELTLRYVDHDRSQYQYHDDGDGQRGVGSGETSDPSFEVLHAHDNAGQDFKCVSSLITRSFRIKNL